MHPVIHNIENSRKTITILIFKKTMFSNTSPNGQKFCLEMKMIKEAERIPVVPKLILFNQDTSRCNSHFLTE